MNNTNPFGDEMTTRQSSDRLDSASNGTLTAVSFKCRTRRVLYPALSALLIAVIGGIGYLISQNGKA